MLPQTDADKSALTASPEGVHLTVGNSLHSRSEERNENEDDRRSCQICAEAYCIGGGKNTGVDHEGGNYMNTEQIDYGVKQTRFLLQHRVTPILMLKTAEGVRPVESQSDPPECDRQEQKNAKGGKPAADGKCDKDNGGLNRPIGIVDRGVAKDKAEDKGNDGCDQVGNKKPEPEVEVKREVGENSHRRRNYVNEKNRHKA